MDVLDFLLFEPLEPRSRKSSRKRKERSMFYEPPHHPELAKIVTFKSVEAAKEAANKLLKLFRKARSRERKLIILRATQLAANRARAGARNPKFSPSTRKRWLRIAEIYEKASEKMEREYK